MKKLMVCLPAMALLIALSSSAQAEDGAVNSATLQAMGLGGMQVMSDSQAMGVRGKGFLTPNSAAIVGGISYAQIDPGVFGQIGTGEINFYLADGKYMAMGETISIAEASYSIINILEVKGQPAEKTTFTRTLTIGAGGSSMASAL